MIELSLLGMVERLAVAEIAIHIGARKALERVAVKVEATAKDEFGVYQDAVGPFPAWAELAESTQEQRAQQGYTPNDPLLRRGDLRNSIGHEVEDLTAIIGSTSEIMEYQEFGTATIPPRPVLGPAVVHNREVIMELLGGAVVNGMVGRDVIHPSLGYADTITE